MKRTVWFLGLALTLAAAGPTRAAAQTRITVAVGLGVPRPFLSGVVVVGRPPRPFAYYPAPAVIVVPAPRPYFYRYRYSYRRPFVVVRRVYAGRYHRRYHWDYDDE